jgi:bacterioferritin-associated ferredoxin
MEDCCEREAEPRPGSCPRCGRAGREIERITLKALLRPDALARLGPEEHRFCATPECPVVYFHNAEVYRREDVVVPVFQKELEGGRTVCYCFGISEDQIRREVETSGFSAAADRIKVLVRSGRCACEVRNPQGICCLGNVAAVGRSVTATAPPTLTVTR